MCGIGGIMVAPGGTVDGTKLQALSAALAHRGPDGAGLTQADGVALVHRRLAIVDVAGGQQPLFGGSAALVANGEIYNDPELRARLPGTEFATGSDCEPPLYLAARDGAAYPGALRGMYAVALHDRAAGTVLLSRDPFGIKPLYTAAIPGGLAFASEPQALLAAGLVARAERLAARAELLELQFTTGSATIFEGIDRVLPGETLTCLAGAVVARTRLEALPAGPPERLGEAAALERLNRALTDSVEHHQRADVPYGMFLSGGIDSAAILAVMARLNRERVLAYTAGFDVPGAADERAAAAVTAQAAGARHETVEITQAMVWRELPRIVAAMDDPTCDYAIIPSWFLARRARQDVKVVLCGEGGDELFAGYGRYRRALRPWWQGGRAMRRRGTFDGLGVLRAPDPRWRGGIEAAGHAVATAGRGRLQIAQATDCADWLPHDLLSKLDRCLMAHGVEGRTPFLDPAVAAAAFRLPNGLKVAGGQGKYLLRAWLAEALPQARPFAPKQGFTVPVAVWIAQVGARLGPLVAAQPGVQAVADPSRVRALFEHADEPRRGFAAWTLLFYALWHRAHLEGLSTAGDVWSVLGARSR